MRREALFVVLVLMRPILQKGRPSNGHLMTLFNKKLNGEGVVLKYRRYIPQQNAPILSVQEEPLSISKKIRRLRQKAFGLFCRVPLNCKGTHHPGIRDTPSRAFYKWPLSLSAEISDTVRSIKSYAFYYCSEMVTVTL